MRSHLRDLERCEDEAGAEGKWGMKGESSGGGLWSFFLTHANSLFSLMVSIGPLEGSKYGSWVNFCSGQAYYSSGYPNHVSEPALV